MNYFNNCVTCDDVLVCQLTSGGVEVKCEGNGGERLALIAHQKTITPIELLQIAIVVSHAQLITNRTEPEYKQIYVTITVIGGVIGSSYTKFIGGGGGVITDMDKTCQ